MWHVPFDMNKPPPGSFYWVTPYPTRPGVEESFLFNHDDVTSPKEFWTERRQVLVAGTKPTRHNWTESDTDVKPVLDNIAAATHACTIRKSKWIRQCFATKADGVRFLLSLQNYQGHINSYWYYALLNIADVDGEKALDANELAKCLWAQALRTGQLSKQTLLRSAPA